MAEGGTVKSGVRLLLSAGLISAVFLHALAIGNRRLIRGAVSLLLNEGEVVVELLRTLGTPFGKGCDGGQGHQAGKHQSREFHRRYSHSV